MALLDSLFASPPKCEYWNLEIAWRSCFALVAADARGRAGVRRAMDQLVVLGFDQPRTSTFECVVHKAVCGPESRSEM